MPQPELARRTSKQLLAAQHFILEMIASGAPLGEVLRAVAAFIDRQASPGICAIYLLDTDGSLRLKAGPKLPPGFAAVVDRVVIGPAGVACGTAADRQKRVVISDIA